MDLLMLSYNFEKITIIIDMPILIEHYKARTQKRRGGGEPCHVRLGLMPYISILTYRIVRIKPAVLLS